MASPHPELSTRPFTRSLYPDISYRDNAFYTDDTITSRPTPRRAEYGADNFHDLATELGHGVMDRLMGDEIQLADTGGLRKPWRISSLKLVINDVTGGLFPGKEALASLTIPLSSDERSPTMMESYGGAMTISCDSSMAHFGRAGLVKVTESHSGGRCASLESPWPYANVVSGTCSCR